MGIHNKNISDINKSIGGFGNDVSKSYYFSVNIPALFSEAVDVSTMTVFCTSTSTPSYALKSKQISYQNVDINIVEGCKFGEWSVNFISDEQNIIRSNLLTWANVAWDYNRKAAASPRSYKKNIEVNQLDRLGEPVATYLLIGAYPELVSDYKLDNGGNDIVKFNVSFKMDYFTVKFNRIPAIQPAVNSRPADTRSSFSSNGNSLLA